jgi:uncharacterized protein involved in exopolysaccharide biosynthesis
MEDNLDYQEIAGILQQRIAALTANYEGQVAVLQTQLQELNRRLTGGWRF